MGGQSYASLGSEQKAKAIARGKLNLAVYHGRVKRQPCEVCGATENIEAHHEDYAKPLEVEWLCPEHHREREQKEKVQ
jgi:hypothetical protein